jgi:hypothetical protein
MIFGDFGDLKSFLIDYFYENMTHTYDHLGVTNLGSKTDCSGFRCFQIFIGDKPLHNFKYKKKLYLVIHFTQPRISEKVCDGIEKIY